MKPQRNWTHRLSDWLELDKPDEIILMLFGAICVFGILYLIFIN